MTKEEKIKILEKEKAYMLSHGGDKQAIALDSAIKALEQEQEPVLDKIRAEIESIDLLAKYTRGDIKRMALAIIDKYKAESELKE